MQKTENLWKYTFTNSVQKLSLKALVFFYQIIESPEDPEGSDVHINNSNVQSPKFLISVLREN